MTRTAYFRDLIPIDDIGIIVIICISETAKQILTTKFTESILTF